MEKSAWETAGGVMFSHHRKDIKREESDQLKTAKP